MKLVIILCSLDCRQRAKRKMSWPWKNFSAWLFFSSLVRCKSNSRRKEIRSDFWSNLTHSNRKKKTDFLTFFSFSFFDEMDDWHISRMFGWEYWKKLWKTIEQQKLNCNKRCLWHKNAIYECRQTIVKVIIRMHKFYKWLTSVFLIFCFTCFALFRKFHWD